MGFSDGYRVRLRVRGVLGSEWSAVIDGADVDPAADGTTLIRGEIRDQAALHGLLAAIRDLGLPLVSMVAAADPDRPHGLDPGGSPTSAARGPGGCRSTAAAPLDEL